MIMIPQPESRRERRGWEFDQRQRGSLSLHQRGKVLQSGFQDQGGYFQCAADSPSAFVSLLSVRVCVILPSPSSSSAEGGEKEPPSRPLLPTLVLARILSPRIEDAQTHTHWTAMQEFLDSRLSPSSSSGLTVILTRTRCLRYFAIFSPLSPLLLLLLPFHARAPPGRLLRD